MAALSVVLVHLAIQTVQAYLKSFVVDFILRELEHTGEVERLDAGFLWLLVEVGQLQDLCVRADRETTVNAPKHNSQRASMA